MEQELVKLPSDERTPVLRRPYTAPAIFKLPSAPISGKTIYNFENHVSNSANAGFS